MPASGLLEVVRAVTGGGGAEPTPLSRPLRVVLISPRNPLPEADTFRIERVSSNVYDLVLWEVDFIREVLAPFDVAYSYVEHPSQLEPCHIVVYSRNQYKRKDISRGLRHASPTIVFHLSDEYGRDVAWIRFLKDYPLVLRQYNFDSYPYHRNIKPIPLGYMVGMIEGPSTTTEIMEALGDRERQYTWSFVGGVKKGKRGAVLKTFDEIGPHFVGALHPAEMAEVYRNSSFVLCPAGDFNVLCFRNFEASICGAIPVVGGTTRERYLEATEPLGDPPWIFHESWKDGLEEVRALLADEPALRARRMKVLAWWAAELDRTRNRIGSILGASRASIGRSRWRDVFAERLSARLNARTIRHPPSTRSPWKTPRTDRA
jgi:hypothetical protein